MEISIKVEYEPINNIYLSSNGTRILLISNDNKEISAKKNIRIF